jgi:ribosomal protein L29
MLSIQELRSSTKKELLAELENARRNMVKIRISTKTKSLKDSSSVSKQKKYVAQIKTTLKELDIEEMVKQANTIQ